MKTVNVKIEGISPLLQHRFPTAGADEPSKKRTGVPDYKAEAELSLYKDSGQIYQPSSHIEGALANAAKSFKISGKRGATYRKLVASTIEVWPDAIPHIFQEYMIDERPVVIQKARVIRYRPRFDKWALEFELRLLDDQLSPATVKEILDHAGLYVGIGDWRPDKAGKFGKFMVTKYEVK